MVKGLNKFKEYFENYYDNYVIIGGTACDIILDGAGFIPRVTRDIDIIVVIEALNAAFIKRFWEFILKGNYEQKEKSDNRRKYYRFQKPENKDFPYQVELFSRIPDAIEFEVPGYITPIPVNDDLSSLSAILLNDDYYNYIIKHSALENGIHFAKIEALICLKAKAFLDMLERKDIGENNDQKNILKHKTDVFRLSVMLLGNDVFELPESIKGHLQAFVEAINDDLPDDVIFRNMGLRNTSAENVYHQILRSFQVKGK